MSNAFQATDFTNDFLEDGYLSRSLIEASGNTYLGWDEISGSLYISKSGSTNAHVLKKSDDSNYPLSHEGFKAIAAESFDFSNYLALANDAGTVKIIKFDESWISEGEITEISISSPEYFQTETMFSQPLFFDDSIDGIETESNYNSWAPSEPELGRVWSIYNWGQYGDDSTVDADVDAYEVFSHFKTPESAISNEAGGRKLIAIIDSGLNYNHEDLKSQYALKRSEVIDGIDNDQNGLVDDRYGWDFHENDHLPWDDVGHGTHVAGTAGAAENGSGIVGLNPAARLVIIKNGGSSGPSTVNSIKSINYAITTGAMVINMSWGGPNYSEAMLKSLKAAQKRNIIMIAAAGNDSINIDNNPTYPASYKIKNMITVASTNYNDTNSTFTNYGKNSVDIMAPGTDIWSADYTGNSSYKYASGTSMAAPLVSGIVSYYWSNKPSLKAKKVVKNVLKSVDDLGYSNYIKTGGRINMAKLFKIDSNTRTQSTPEDFLIQNKTVETWEDSIETATSLDSNPVISRAIDIDEESITDDVILFVKGKRRNSEKKILNIRDYVNNGGKLFDDNVDTITSLSELRPGFGILEFNDLSTQESRSNILKSLFASGMILGVEMDSEMTYY